MCPAFCCWQAKTVEYLTENDLWLVKYQLKFSDKCGSLLKIQYFTAVSVCEVSAANMLESIFTFRLSLR